MIDLTLPPAASGAIAETEGGRILHERWQALRAGADGGARLRTTVGLSTVVGIIELSNLIKTLSQADKGTEEYVQLTGSAFSVSAATAQLAYIPFEAINATNTAAGLKIASGYLGALAAWVGSGLDFSNVRAKLGDGETLIATLYGLKGLAGLAAGSSYVLTALSASAPLFERLASRLVGRQVELVFLGTVGRSVAAAEASAAARAAAIAAGETAEEAGRRGAAAAAGVLGERAGLMAVGRVLLFLGSWQIQVGLIGLQVFIWWLTDDALQECLERSVFGTDPEYSTPEKQDEEFNKALVDVGLKAEAAER